MFYQRLQSAAEVCKSKVFVCFTFAGKSFTHADYGLWDAFSPTPIHAGSSSSSCSETACWHRWADPQFPRRQEQYQKIGKLMPKRPERDTFCYFLIRGLFCDICWYADLHKHKAFKQSYVQFRVFDTFRYVRCCLIFVDTFLRFVDIMVICFDTRVFLIFVDIVWYVLVGLCIGGGGGGDVGPPFPFKTWIGPGSLDFICFWTCLVSWKRCCGWRVWITIICSPHRFCFCSEPRCLVTALLNNITSCMTKQHFDYVLSESFLGYPMDLLTSFES